MDLSCAAPGSAFQTVMLRRQKSCPEPRSRRLLRPAASPPYGANNSSFISSGRRVNVTSTCATLLASSPRGVVQIQRATVCSDVRDRGKSPSIRADNIRASESHIAGRVGFFAAPPPGRHVAAKASDPPRHYSLAADQFAGADDNGLVHHFHIHNHRRASREHVARRSPSRSCRDSRGGSPSAGLLMLNSLELGVISDAAAAQLRRRPLR